MLWKTINKNQQSGKKKSDHISYISKTEFYQPTGEIIDCGDRLTDNNPMTFIFKSHYAVKISFSRPVQIYQFMLQTRTDDNNVKPDCDYELMYWDKRWISTGRKEASDTVIAFENIPSGTAYWLINHSLGIEEQLFLYKNGRQWWPSVSCYEGRVGELLGGGIFCVE